MARQEVEKPVLEAPDVALTWLVMLAVDVAMPWLVMMVQEEGNLRWVMMLEPPEVKMPWLAMPPRKIGAAISSAL